MASLLLSLILCLTIPEPLLCTTLCSSVMARMIFCPNAGRISSSSYCCSRLLLSILSIIFWSSSSVSSCFEAFSVKRFLLNFYCMLLKFAKPLDFDWIVPNWKFWLPFMLLSTPDAWRNIALLSQPFF
jgi:hypothetical protein